MKPIRVLLVEDNAVDAKCVLRALRSSMRGTFQVTHTSLLKDALARLEEDDYEVVLLDLSLPDSDGKTTVQQIQEIAPRTPVVVLTGHDDAELVDTLLAAGVQDYITKGKETEEVLQRSLCYAVERQNLIQELQSERKELKEFVEAIRSGRIDTISGSAGRSTLLRILDAGVVEENERLLAELCRSNAALRTEVAKHEQTEAALRESEELLRTVINVTQDAILAVGEDGLITILNPAAERMFGQKCEDMIGASLGPLMPEQYRRRHAENLRSYFATGKPNSAIGKAVELPGLRSDGTVFPMEISLSPGRRGNRQLVVAVARDVTERKQAERAREQAEGRLAQNAAELARSNQELDQFAYVASHDLQEPVRKLIAFSDLLAKDLGADLPEQASRYLGFITDAAQRMHVLVQDLLTLSRAGRSPSQREQVSLNECADRAMEALAARIKETGAEVTRDELPTVEGDRTLLTQLYQNLIGNALKFVTADQTPVVRLTAEEMEGEWVFGVRDNGIGLKPEYAEQIFVPFKRLHGRSEYEGSGIGLAICRKTVERHGGKIWVESEQGKGAHFKFTISEDAEYEVWQDETAKQPVYS